jgi:hypothetical protein
MNFSGLATYLRVQHAHRDVQQQKKKSSFIWDSRLANFVATLSLYYMAECKLVVLTSHTCETIIYRCLAAYRIWIRALSSTSCCWSSFGNHEVFFVVKEMHCGIRVEMLTHVCVRADALLFLSVLPEVVTHLKLESDGENVSLLIGVNGKNICMQRHFKSILLNTSTESRNHYIYSSLLKKHNNSLA